MRRRLIQLLAVFACFARSAYAQDDIRAYVANLPHMELRELTAASSGNGDKLQRAFASLELHVRSSNEPDAARALRQFKDVVQRDSMNAWGHFGLGLTLSRVRSKTAVYRILNLDNSSALGLMEEEFKRALELDPSLTEAQSALDAIKSMLAQSPLPRRLMTNVTSSGSETPLEKLHRAVTLFRAGGHDADAAKLYYAGLVDNDSLGLNEYAEDVRLIASGEEMIFLTDGSPKKREDAFHKFWRKRSVRDGVSESYRIGEHYRRLAYALGHYRPPFNVEVQSRNADGSKRQGLERFVDDRGVIYMRYGPPTERAGSLVRVTQSAAPVEGWAYTFPDGSSEMFFFTNGVFNTQVRELGERNEPTINALLAKYDMRVAFIGAHTETVRLWEFMLRTIPEGDYATWKAMVDRKRSDAEEDNDRMARRIRERILNRLFAALDADRAPYVFGKQLLVFSDFATFRGNGCTDVVYSVLSPVPDYNLNVAVADTFAWEVHSVDARVTAKETINGQNLRATGVMCATPDPNAYVTVTVNNDTAGATTGGELNVRDYRGDDLMISDMLFAADRPGAFVRGNAKLSLIPPRQFREGEALRVFYELYNLPRGSRYKTEMTLTTLESNFFIRLFKGKSTTTVTFDDIVNSDGVVQELRSVIPQVDPGEVMLTVKVTDLQTGKTASTKKKLWIIPKAS